MIKLLSFKNNSKTFLIFVFLISFFIIDLSKANNNNETSKRNTEFAIDYLDPKKELEDYIIDSGDELYIDFYPAKELSDTYIVNAEGEIYLPRLYETYVRGLTTSDLKELLEKKYLEYLIEPKIKIRIALFRQSKVLIQGEVRYTGLYKFPAFRSAFPLTIQEKIDAYSDIDAANKISQDNFRKMNKDIQSGDMTSGININIDGNKENITTISDVIRRAGGITSLTDLSKIEIIREVPLRKGGGKKRAFVDLTSFMTKSDVSNDLRVFDGDIIIIPKLVKASSKQIPQSILSGLSPKFITVNVYGQVANPGPIKLPQGATLSDAFDLTGPIKPLSGKVVLFRYKNDGTILRKKISYSERGERGSKRNPLIKEGDFISVKNSVLGKSTGFMKEFLAPFVGINAAKELFESF